MWTASESYRICAFPLIHFPYGKNDIYLNLGWSWSVAAYLNMPQHLGIYKPIINVRFLNLYDDVRLLWGMLTGYLSIQATR